MALDVLWYGELVEAFVLTGVFSCHQLRIFAPVKYYLEKALVSLGFHVFLVSRQASTLGIRIMLISSVFCFALVYFKL